MRFLVLGAAGFVGRHIVAQLLVAGHTVVAAGRDVTLLARVFPAAQTVKLDLAAPLSSQVESALQQTDIIVNAAGLLDGPQLDVVHTEGPRALYAAASQAGVGRIILISAISARGDVATPYAQTKLAGEAVLKGSGVAWTILRPSLVIAKGSFGGTSVLRGLAGFPLVAPVVADMDADFSPLHAADLGRVVVRVAEDPKFAGRVLEPAGPETITLTALTARYRKWLGLGPAREVRVPLWIGRLVCRLGDILGGGPISTASLNQLMAGNAGVGRAFAREIGFDPRGLDAILTSEPADVQDRWHARLYFLGIASRFALIVLWLGSALSELLGGAAMAEAFLVRLGLPAGLTTPLVIGTGFADLAVASLLLVPPWRRWATGAQLGLVAIYTIGLTLAMPGLWLEPFGALLKNVPILALILIDHILAERR